MRCQPPVRSSVSAGGLLKGLVAALRPGEGDAQQLKEVLVRRHGAQSVVLMDSGTSALVAAMRLLSGGRVGYKVACPAYICVDVGAAAQRAGARLVLYDTDSATLSPDIDSLRRVVARGVDAVLVAHLYGFPVALNEVRALCDAAGVPMLEDAAQHAGARYAATALGGFGDAAVLSFGRGKGSTGGGGALLYRGTVQGGSDSIGVAQDGLLPVAAARLPKARAGIRELVGTAAQWLLARPSMYQLPLAIPGLHLGEMIYSAASEPGSMSRASIALLMDSLGSEDESVATRRGNAQRVLEIAAESDRVRTIRPVEGAEVSYLRLPVVDMRGDLREDRRIGAVRGYPRLLHENGELGDSVVVVGESLAGAAELKKHLFTLPTHDQLRHRDFVAMREWLVR